MRGEVGGEPAAHLLRRRLRGDQLRVALLQRRPAPATARRTARRRRPGAVEHVVAELVVGDLRGQLGVPLAGLGRRLRSRAQAIHGGRQNRGSGSSHACRSTRGRRPAPVYTVLGRVDEGLGQLAAQGQRAAGPGRVGAGQAAGRGGHGQRGQPGPVEAEPVGQVERRCGPAPGRSAAGRGRGWAPARAAAGCRRPTPRPARPAGRAAAVSPATSGSVASMPSAAAPMPASSRTGGRAAQQCTTTGTPSAADQRRAAASCTSRLAAPRGTVP